MSEKLTATGLPVDIARAIGIGADAFEESGFMDAVSAFARGHAQPKPPTPEQVAALRRAAKKNNPLHIKAVARRRKRKKGGPK